MMKKLRIQTLLAVFLLIAPFALHAATTGDLFGVVTDETGAGLPGVTVSLSGPNMQGSRVAVTNSNGEYQFKLVPPGDYSVEFRLEGFDPQVKEKVKISLDTTSKLNATMSLGTFAESITVSADTVLVDPTSTTVQQNFGQEHLKYAAVGSANRSYQNILQQAPGVAGGSNPNVLGANSGQNNYMLDGVTTTDPVTHTFGSNLPFDAIQEISIQTLGKEAEYGRAVGGVVNVVTKTGGNTFSGSLDARYRDQDFYQSGDHFDPDAQPTKNFNPSATLGGPVVRDKLWFFGSLENVDTQVTNPALFSFSPGTRTFDGWNSLGKLTFTPFANQTLSFRYTNNDATIDFANNSSYYMPEADRVQSQKSTIYNLGYDVILSPEWIAQLQVGLRDGFLESRPYGDTGQPGTYNLTTGVYSDNYYNWQYGNRDRTEIQASTTYFLDSAGTHAIKVGGSTDKSEFPRYNNYTGNDYFQQFCNEEFGFEPGMQCGGIIYTRNTSAGDDQQYYASIYSISPVETYESELTSFFAQDEWHPIPAVTARLGLRYDSIDFSVPSRADAPSLNKLQPRLGLAWDLFNDANTVLHAFYGQTMDDNGLTLASFGSTQGSIRARAFYNADTGLHDRLIDVLGSGAANVYDPNLEATYSDEIMVGLTQRIWRNTSVDVTGVWRDSKNMFEDSCADAQCDVFMMTNHPFGAPEDALRNEYQGIITKLETRPYNWLSALVSYTWAESKGSVEYTQNAGSDFDVNPYHSINRFGYLSDDARHRVKLSGFARAPWGTVLGIDYNWRSELTDFGDAYATSSASSPFTYGNLYVVPRGDRRVPSLQQLDLQLIHEIPVGPATVGLIGAVYNVFDTETVTNLGSGIGGYAECSDITATAQNATAGDCIANPLFGIEADASRGVSVSSGTFNQAIDWQSPRRYEIGIRIDF